MSYSRRHRIRFSDCDPAGIVFYPQYFVLFNDLLEEWIDTLLEGGFADYIGRHRYGLPTVRLEAEFRNVSRMGEEVVLTLDIARISARSFDLRLECRCPAGVSRMSATQTLVTTSLETHQSIPIPDELRRALERSYGPALQAAGGAL